MLLQHYRTLYPNTKKVSSKKLIIFNELGNNVLLTSNRTFKEN